MAVSFRNIARYVRDVQANTPLYEAIGFRVVRDMGEHMAILQNDDGLKLVLHKWDRDGAGELDTAIGLTMEGSVEESRKFLEGAGFRCLREPEEGDEGFFFIYGDLDGNPVNLVGKPTGPPA